MVTSVEEIRARNDAFLAHSQMRMIPMNTPDGTTYAAGAKRRFTAPVVPGWAAFIRVFYNLTNTVTLNAGTATASVAAPWNVVQNLRVLYGGNERRNHHPYGLKLLKQTSEHDASYPWYSAHVTQSYSAGLFTTTPTAAGANTWKGFMDIPLQLNPASVVGLLPMGMSASPVTLELDLASSSYGTDPLLHPVIVTGAATAAITGTITAVVYYRYAQSTHDPRIQVPAPVIGSFAKITQQETPISITTGVTYAELREPYAHVKIFQIGVVPGAANGQFVTHANLAGAAFDLDPSSHLFDYTASGATIDSLWYDQRDRYAQDLDAGVIAWDFISGSDAKHPDGMSIVNIQLYNSARAGLHYNGALAASSNRILTMAMFMEPMEF